VRQTSTFIGPLVSSAITTASGNDNMPFAFLFGLWVSWQRSISYWLEIFSQWGVEYYLSLDGRRWQESKGMRRVHFGREFPSSIYPIGIRCIANCIRELFWGEKYGVFLIIFVLRPLVPCHTDEHEESRFLVSDFCQWLVWYASIFLSGTFFLPWFLLYFPTILLQ